MENFKMEMMFLIVKLAYASVTIPEKYPAEQCKSIAAEINNSRYEAICIPAPKPNSLVDLTKCIQDNTIAIRCPANGAK